MTGTIPARYSANISMLFTEVAFLERPAAAAAAGFRNIECWWPFATPAPGDGEVDAFLAAIEGSGVALRALNFYAGNMPSGERGVACRPDRQGELRASTDILVRIAQQTGCRSFNLLYGQLDSRWPEAEQHETAMAAIRTAAAAVSGFGGTLLLEPLARGLNGAYPLLTGYDVVTLIEKDLVGPGNIRLLFDVFHLGSNGVDIVAAARELGPHIGHVQLADAPGRGEPGSGQLPIAAAISALEEAGYAGYFGCEYKPTNGTVNSLDWISRDPATATVYSSGG